MRIFLLATALLSGGGAVAMQNEDVQEHVNNMTQRARYVIQHRAKQHLLEEVKETGFPYPPQAFLDTLTDEQEALVLTTIDQINAEYDWANMTDEEIIEALKLIKTELDAFYEELGIDGPNWRQRVRDYMQHRRQERQENIVAHVQENGIPYPPQTFLDTLTDEQEVLVLSTIDQINAEYDWANMTEDEIIEALKLVKTELDAFYEELGIDGPTWRQRMRDYMQHRRQERQENIVAHVQENGIPYPSDEVLADLTEEQSTAVTALIDQYNADNDWANMTDDEILAVLETFRSEMVELKEALDIDIPLAPRQEQPFNRFRRHHRGGHYGPEDDTEEDIPEDSDQV